jgi:hypothetical protein
MSHVSRNDIAKHTQSLTTKASSKNMILVCVYVSAGKSIGDKELDLAAKKQHPLSIMYFTTEVSNR